MYINFASTLSTRTLLIYTHMETGTTDIPLTEQGERLITALSERVAGPGKLLDPAHIAHTLVSPRTRAQKTFQLLFPSSQTRPQNVTTDERVREWTYGAYEGALVKDVNSERKAKGEKAWNIWEEGCPQGESVEQMTERVDEAVEHIRKLHREWIEGPHESEQDIGGDVLIISHGHFSRIYGRVVVANLSAGGGTYKAAQVKAEATEVKHLL
ncbi:hypothetical protein EMMF5_000037 [Cystobasidiomycetes sp. EMM_F5]